jgi:uncharacterized protein (DUF1501 family)
VLASGLAGMGCALAWPGLPWRGSARPDDEAPTLVLLELNGGNDGLNTIVPWGDDAYHAARPTLALPRSALLPLDDQRGFHPSLVGLRERWERGRVAVVEGVGYPQPNLSHFKSLEIWGTGDARGAASGDGWIPRLLRAAYPERDLAMRAVHVGAIVPQTMCSQHAPVLCLRNAEGYKWAEAEDSLMRLAAEPAETPADPRERLGAVLRDAHGSSGLVREAVARYRTPTAYPDTPLADALRTAAALIDGGLGSRVLSATLVGFDTHAAQRDLHAALLATFDGALSAFLADLDRTGRGRRTVVLVYSEFGRRVAENASAGTDHGAAAPLFLAGATVRGGLYGRPPSLTELDEQGDLVYTTDFRGVYATLARRAFGVDPATILPGSFAELDLLEA